MAVDGGCRLSGVGSFCSGCDNAQWQLLGGMIPQPGAAAKPGFFLLRSADCVIDDNWHTMGLAGTGSKNIVARDAFVPAHRTLAFAELTEATAPGMRANPNPLYRQSFLAVLPITIVSRKVRPDGTETSQSAGTRAYSANPPWRDTPRS